MPNSGIGYGALRGAYGQAAAPLPPVSLNFLGTLFDNRRSASADDLNWQLDPNFFGVSRPEGSSDGAVDVTARCENGRLIFDVERRLSPSLTRRFTDSLRQSLEELAASKDVVTLADRRGTPSPPTAFGDGEDIYIVANESVGGKSLFVLPPGEGGAESYLRNIARRIDGVRVVLFNNFHRKRRMDSFEELAQFYVGHIRSQQPIGHITWPDGASEASSLSKSPFSWRALAKQSPVFRSSTRSST